MTYNARPHKHLWSNTALAQPMV